MSDDLTRVTGISTMFKTNFENKKEITLFTLSLIAIPIVIYFYFLKWRTDVPYGDDLYLFKNYFNLHDFWTKLNMLVPSGKYRPVQGFAINLVIELFGKNLTGYYLFNIGVQAMNTLLFALTLNLFLRSPFFSLLFSLVVGLSRFSLFNITQLLNGGVLEGLAMTFFLAFLYFMMKAMIKKELTSDQRYRAMLLALLLANLTVYTHERYTVLFAFIILGILFLPPLKTIGKKRRGGIIVLSLASIFLNITIKKNIFSLAYFTGTGGTQIDFSFASALSFFKDGLLSILQVNSGPEYIVGIPFSNLPLTEKALVLSIAFGALAILTAYSIQAVKSFKEKGTEEQHLFFTFLSLIVLSVLLLIPAVITIRLEQRWLQASYSCFVLFSALALTNLKVGNNWTKSYWPYVFVILFLWSDTNYLRKGGHNIYLSSATSVVAKFKQAIDNNVISANSAKLYIWETRRNENDEQAIRWDIGDGYFFNFYRGKSKTIVFEDSIYQRKYSFPVSSFINFNSQSEQIIYIADNGIVDLSDSYLKDSLKSFTPERAALMANGRKFQYDSDTLLINEDNFDKFLTSGFYDSENGIRWTNGKASIEFLGNYVVKDSLNIELTTYMPPICKNIIPKISFTGQNETEYQPVESIRDGDKFIFKFHLKQLTSLQRISIVSDTINATPPDLRVLSFPFISLQLRK